MQNTHTRMHIPSQFECQAQAQPQVQPQTSADPRVLSGEQIPREDMPSSAIPPLPTYAQAPHGAPFESSGQMPSVYINAIRDILLSTLESQLKPMQQSMDGLSNQFSLSHSNVAQEVQGVTKKVASLEDGLKQTNDRLSSREAM